jgi:hypothetical protein
MIFSVAFYRPTSTDFLVRIVSTLSRKKIPILNSNMRKQSRLDLTEYHLLLARACPLFAFYQHRQQKPSHVADIYYAKRDSL